MPTSKKIQRPKKPHNPWTHDFMKPEIKSDDASKFNYHRVKQIGMKGKD